MRLDMHSNEIAKLLKERGYTASQPFDIKFFGETARVSLDRNDHAIVKRTAQGTIQIDYESKMLQHLWVDELNPRP